MITLKNGDTLTVLCSFNHQGKAFNTGSIRAAICQHGGFPAAWNEKLFAVKPVTGIIDDVVPGFYTVELVILIKDVGTVLFPEGLYELYAKMTGIPGSDLYFYGFDDDIQLQGFGDAVFSNLTVNYSKA